MVHNAEKFPSHFPLFFTYRDIHTFKHSLRAPFAMKPTSHHTPRWTISLFLTLSCLLPTNHTLWLSGPSVSLAALHLYEERNLFFFFLICQCRLSIVTIVQIIFVDLNCSEVAEQEDLSYSAFDSQNQSLHEGPLSSLVLESVQRETHSLLPTFWDLMARQLLSRAGREKISKIPYLLQVWRLKILGIRELRATH